MNNAPPMPAGPEISYQAIRVEKPAGSWWEQAMVALWLLVTFIPFPNDELLLYPLALGFAGLFALRFREMVPLALRCWPLFLIPILCCVSMFWSSSPSGALRLGVMMILTLVIALYAGGRLTPRQVLQAVFAACSVSVFVALPELNSLGDQYGLYAQKNIFAIRMMLALITSLALALDWKQPILLRLVAIPYVPLTAYMILRAESATALLLALAAFGIIVAIYLFWTNVSRIRHLRTFVLIALAAFALLGLLLFLNMPNNAIVQSILFEFGKDTTLTGRTVLWADAARLSERSPWLGWGAAGFWQPWNGEAEAILEYSYKESGTQFSFHSTYYEVLVHLGRVGLFFLIFQIAWMMYQASRNWAKSQAMPQTFLLTYAGISLITTFTESYLFGVFDIAIVLFLLTAVSGVTERDRVRTVLVPESPSPTVFAQ
ncbi:MAG: O-antigen ligase family protein [Pseudomonadota bacterium]